MAKTYLTAFLLCFSSVCLSQQRELDSLILVLQSYSKQDTIRVQLLNDIAFYYSRIDPAKGLKAAEEAATLAINLRDDNRLAASYSYKAMNLSGLGDDSLSLEFYKRTLAIHEKLGNNLRMGTAFNNIAITLVNLSDYTNALLYHQKAFKIFEMLKDSVRMGNSLNNRGVIYLYLADYRQALDLHFQALRIFEYLKDRQVTANTLVNIGLVYDHLFDFEKSLKYQQEAYELYSLSGDKRGMINTLGNIGNVYHNMNNNGQALSYYGKALEYSRETGDKRGIASNISNMGIVYSGMGNYRDALNNFDTSLKMNMQSGDKKRISADLYEIGKIYFEAPDSFLKERGIANRFDRVRDYELRSLKLAEEIGSLDVQREALNILSQAYEKQRSWPQALDAFKNYVRLRDSVINNDIKRDIDKKEIGFEFEKREMALKASQQRQHDEALATIARHRVIKNSAIAITAIVMIAGFVSFRLYKRKRDADEKQKLAEFRLKEVENEMDLLLLQMNPHFIFNSLNSINNYIDNNEKDKSTLYTTKFAKLMRLTLENSRKKEIPLADDLHLLELYLELEALRLRRAFSYEIKVDDAIDSELTFVPPMLLQPFVENSIWHGVSGKAAGGKILVEVKKQEGMINYIIEDNGVGRKVNKPGAMQKNSMGMQISSRRIDRLNEFKKTNGSVRVVDLEEGLRVEVILPFETYS